MNATGNGTDSSDSGSDGVLEYDPSVPAPYGHRTMELVTICVVNGLTRECFRPLRAMRRVLTGPLSSPGDTHPCVGAKSDPQAVSARRLLDHGRRCELAWEDAVVDSWQRHLYVSLVLTSLASFDISALGCSDWHQPIRQRATSCEYSRCLGHTILAGMSRDADHAMLRGNVANRLQFSWGWVGYYLVSSMVKVSTCSCLLEIRQSLHTLYSSCMDFGAWILTRESPTIVPHPFLVFRRLVYCLCFIIVALGISEASLWLFQCRPFLSNFIYSVPSDYCLDIDIPRYGKPAIISYPHSR